MNYWEHPQFNDFHNWLDTNKSVFIRARDKIGSTYTIAECVIPGGIKKHQDYVNIIRSGQLCSGEATLFDSVAMAYIEDIFSYYAELKIYQTVDELVSDSIEHIL